MPLPHQDLGLLAGVADHALGLGPRLVLGQDPARHPLLDGLLGHRHRLVDKNLPLHHGRDDVLLVQALLLGRGGDGHLVRNRAGEHVQGPSEDAGEAQGVVDLVWNGGGSTIGFCEGTAEGERGNMSLKRGVARGVCGFVRST